MYRQVRTDSSSPISTGERITDPETNQKYTVKRYSSEKEYFDDGTWQHKKITLSPDNRKFEDIPLENVPVGDFRVVAEFVEVVKK